MGGDTDNRVSARSVRVDCMPIFLLQTKIQEKKNEKKSNFATRNITSLLPFTAGKR